MYAVRYLYVAGSDDSPPTTSLCFTPSPLLICISFWNAHTDIIHAIQSIKISIAVALFQFFLKIRIDISVSAAPVVAADYYSLCIQSNTPIVGGNAGLRNLSV